MTFCHKMSILLCIAAWMSMLGVCSAEASCIDELPGAMTSKNSCKKLKKTCSNLSSMCTTTLGDTLGDSTQAKNCRKQLGAGIDVNVEDYCMLSCNHCQCPSAPCQNGGNCTDQTSGDYTCSCANGYDGPNCENDIDECATNPCQNGGTCTDQINDYSCNCVDGYDGENCENDIDECAANPCQNGGICTDQINGYTCNCKDGYDGMNCQNNGNGLPTRQNPPLWTTYREVGCHQTHGSAEIENALLKCQKDESCYAVESIGTKGHYCATDTSYLETKFVNRTNLQFKRDGVVWIKDSCEDGIMNQNPSLIDVAEPNQMNQTEMGIDCGGICGKCPEGESIHHANTLLQICVLGSEDACNDAADNAPSELFADNSTLHVMLGRCDLDGTYSNTTDIKAWFRRWGHSIRAKEIRSRGNIRYCFGSESNICDYSNEYILIDEFESVKVDEVKFTARFRMNSENKVEHAELVLNIVTTYKENTEKHLAGEIEDDDELVNIFTTAATLTAPYYETTRSPPVNRDFTYDNENPDYDILAFLTFLKNRTDEVKETFMVDSQPDVEFSSLHKCDSHYETDCHYQLTLGFRFDLIKPPQFPPVTAFHVRTERKFNFISWFTLSPQNGKIEKMQIHSHKEEQWGNGKCPVVPFVPCSIDPSDVLPNCREFK